MGDRRQEPIYCFVPSNGIDIVVLATYLKTFVDGTATIQPSRHPTKNDEVGYTIGADKALGREVLDDLLKDTRDWKREQQPYDFQDNPYDYNESDTWIARKKAGPTPPRPRDAPRTAKPRTRHEARDNDNSRANPKDNPRDNPRDNQRDNPRGNQRDNPRTFSDVSASTQYTNQSSVFSRDELSTVSEDSIDPSDSASQTYQYESSRGQPKGPPPKPTGPQPPPNAYKGNAGSYGSYGFDKLAISDYAKPNQGATRQQPASRHDPVKEEPKSTRPPAKGTGGGGGGGGGRKDSLYDDAYH